MLASCKPVGLFTSIISLAEIHYSSVELELIIMVKINFSTINIEQLKYQYESI